MSTLTPAQLQSYRTGWHLSQNGKREFEDALDRFKGDHDMFTDGWMDYAAEHDWGYSLKLWVVNTAHPTDSKLSKRFVDKTDEQAEELRERFEALGHTVNVKLGKH